MQDGNQQQINPDINLALAELQKHLMLLKEAVTYIDEAKIVAETSLKALEWLKKLEESYTKLLPGIEKLIKDINDIDFPKRLDSIDTKLTTIVNEVNYIKNLIDKSTIELTKIIHSGFHETNSNLKEGFKNVTSLINTDFEVVTSKLQSLENFINKSFKELKNLHQIELKQIRFNKVINIVTFILIIAILIIIILNISNG